MNAAQVADAVARHFDVRKRVIVPNCLMLGLHGEADLAVVFESGWVEEVEIKVSMADYRRDFETKKYKHGILSGRFGGSQTQANVRKFWYAAPEALAAKIAKELPPYAGLIAVSTETGRFAKYGSRVTSDTQEVARVVVEAPKIPSAKKADPGDIMKALRLCYFRYWKHRHQCDGYEWEGESSESQ